MVSGDNASGRVVLLNEDYAGDFDWIMGIPALRGEVERLEREQGVAPTHVARDMDGQHQAANAQATEAPSAA